MGFGASDSKSRDKSLGEILSHIETEDLLQYGFIPEFIGRFSVLATLNGLGEKDLVRVLTEPKNALVKQYQKFFSLEGVALEFTPDALEEIAMKALKKGTGARALRSILETTMLDIMYDVPSEGDVSKCLITREVVQGKQSPILMRQGEWVKSA